MKKNLHWILIGIAGLLILLANIPCEKEPRIHLASASVVINLAPDKAWHRLSDLTLAHYYVPGLIKTLITTRKKQGVNTSRRVYQSERRYINETVTAWQEGRGFTVKLHNDEGGAPFPFSEASFSYQIAPVSEQQVKMSTSLGYQIGMGCLGYWLHDLILEKTIQDRIYKGAINLKGFYETGKPTNL